MQNDFIPLFSEAANYSLAKFWPNLSSIVVSHVANESGKFTPTYVVNQSTFDYFLDQFMPEPRLAPVKDLVRQQYDCSISPYNSDFQFCLRTLIRDAVFTCNTRLLFNKYYGKAYMMQYSFPAPMKSNAVHASDLIPTFINKATDIEGWLTSLKVQNASQVAKVIKQFRSRYQRYLSSYAAFGNPNTHKYPSTLDWPHASFDGNGNVAHVLEARIKVAAHPFFDIITDQQNTARSCNFWTKIAQNISDLTPESGGGLYGGGFDAFNMEENDDDDVDDGYLLVQQDELR